MDITIVGANYVGLVTAACFSEHGFHIDLVDFDKSKINDLKNDILPIYEPGIDVILKNAKESGKISLYTGLSEINNFGPDIIMISCTPLYNENWEPDMSDVLSVLEQICSVLSKNRYTVIMTRATMSVGTVAMIKKRIKFLRPDLSIHEHYDVVCVPGFLREGSAIHDFVMGYRVVIGVDKNAKKATQIMKELHDPMMKNDVQVIFCNPETAELIKEASNSFIAMTIAFINEFADLCERTGADIDSLIKGIGADPRIGNKCLNVGPGYGGYSLNRDTRIVTQSAETLGVDLSLVRATIFSNENRKNEIVKRITQIFDDKNGVLGKNICVFGVTFRPDTDEIRSSVSAFIIENLIDMGASVSLYDPIYSSEYGVIHPLSEKFKNIRLMKNPYDAAIQADIVIIGTECNEFREIDFKKIKELMNFSPEEKPILMDLRNLFGEELMSDFYYISIGRPVSVD